MTDPETWAIICCLRLGALSLSHSNLRYTARLHISRPTISPSLVRDSFPTFQAAFVLYTPIRAQESLIDYHEQNKVIRHGRAAGPSACGEAEARGESLLDEYNVPVACGSGRLWWSRNVRDGNGRHLIGFDFLGRTDPREFLETRI